MMIGAENLVIFADANSDMYKYGKLRRINARICLAIREDMFNFAESVEDKYR